MKLRRQKDSAEESAALEASEAPEPAPDPATWALPADAAVASGGDVAPAPISVSPPTPPEPRPAPTPPPAPEPAAATVGDRPEILVAGAFAGAFIVAKILKRIGD